MNDLYDLLLPKPIGEQWAWTLLFTTFAAHLLFVLLTLGSAILAFTYHVAARRAKHELFRQWDAFFIAPFYIHKSTAVVLGVAPLLLMQVSRTLPFMTATSLLAPLWMLLILLLLTAFILLETLAMSRPPLGQRWQLRLALLGLVCLLSVPAIFAAVVVTTENPGQWLKVSRSGFLPASLLGHWLLRLLHVIGAALLFGAAFHYLRAAQPGPLLRRHLRAWMLGATAFQIVFGLHLYSSLPHSPGLLANVLVAFGALAAAALLLFALYAWLRDRELPLGHTVMNLGLILLPMLLTRQVLQDSVLLPAEKEHAARAEKYRQELEPYREKALSDFEARNIVSYDKPAVVYARSCSFCHGTVGNGQGDEAVNLVVPPADLTAIRAGKAEIHRVLTQGVRGTGMPPFAMYTRGQLEGVIGFLRSQMGMGVIPEPTTATLSAQVRAEAQVTYMNLCAVCHAGDGQGSELGRRYSPPPPNFRAFTLSPARTFHIITHGYPGTMMASYAKLPETTRWGLAEMVQRFYVPPPEAAAQKR